MFLEITSEIYQLNTLLLGTSEYQYHTTSCRELEIGQLLSISTKFRESAGQEDLNG